MPGMPKDDMGVVLWQIDASIGMMGIPTNLEYRETRH